MTDAASMVAAAICAEALNMHLTRTTGCFALTIALVTMTPALASQADCDAIAAAFDKLGTVPSFRQEVVQDGTAIESRAIGDTLHMNIDGEWMTLPLQPGGRAAIFAGIFDLLVVKECSAAPDDQIEGRSMKVFDYVLPPIEGLSTESYDQRVWIGADDGLPYRATNPTGEVVISYEGVEAPAL